MFVLDSSLEWDGSPAFGPIAGSSDREVEFLGNDT
jgi:hypothetical protein